MNAHAARDVVLVRAIESTDGAREIWTDADRIAVSRAAAEVVGEAASGETYIERRAAFARERIAERLPAAQALAPVAATRGWLVAAGAACAFAIGAAGVDIGPAQRINLLAPPVLALLLWNLGVYLALVVGAISSHTRRQARAPGPIRRTIVAWLRDAVRSLRRSGAPPALAAALGRFFADWTALAMPLWQQRAARLLHLSAAALAAGAIAGLYLRGIVLEYRAGWQSTFLDARSVEAILRVVLAPGSWLTGIAIPARERLQAIGNGAGFENAAPWIHLYSATIVLVCIVPRLVLGTIAWVRERQVAARFPIKLDRPYFQRLLQARREGIARVIALPYSYDIPPAGREGLARLLARVFQTPLDIGWRDSIPYGDDALPDLGAPPPAGVVVIFNLAATPERENHGAFVAALAAHVAGRAPLIAILDTSEFADRFRDLPQRIAERKDAWRRALDAYGIDAQFVRLARPDFADAAATLASAFDRAAQ